TSPTVAEAATTLCTQIMLPAAPPTACSATTIAAPRTSSPMLSAVANWNSENIMLLTVFEPAMNAPRAPMVGANSGQSCPATSETLWASTSGMLGYADVAPELMNTCTIGTAKISAAPAAIVVVAERFQASAYAPRSRYMR